MRKQRPKFAIGQRVHFSRAAIDQGLDTYRARRGEHGVVEAVKDGVRVKRPHFSHAEWYSDEMWIACEERWCTVRHWYTDSLGRLRHRMRER